MDITYLIGGLGIVGSILAAICTAVVPLLILGGVGYYLYDRNKKSMAYRQSTQNWPNTTGTVLVSTTRSKTSGRSRTTYPVVVYQYTVDGKPFQCQTIKAGEQYLNVRLMGQVQETVNRYPIGSSVTVYYNPSNPAEAFLEK